LKHALETTLAEDFLKQGVTTVYELSVKIRFFGPYEIAKDTDAVGRHCPVLVRQSRKNLSTQSRNVPFSAK
jgi:hypothetical protein